MLFIFLCLFYVFILLMSQSIEEERLKKEAKDWKNIIGTDYYG